MSENPKKKFHPIVEKTILMAKKNPNGEIIFDEIAKRDLKNILKKYFKSPELGIVVKDLLTFAYFLDQNNSKEGSKALLEVITTTTEAMQAQVDKLKEMEEYREFVKNQKNEED